MAMAEVVGSMGLTLFCNRCVETFFNFQNDNVSPEDLDQTCDMALNAFSAFCSPNPATQEINDRCGLFSTNEAVVSFSLALESQQDEADDYFQGLMTALDTVRNIAKDATERKAQAEKLQGFFDSLGDYSFGTTRDCLVKGMVQD